MALFDGNHFERAFERSSSLLVLRRCRQYLLQDKYLRSAHRAGEAPLAYFKLSFVRSTESLAMKVALHQFVPNPPGLIAVKEPSNRAF